MALVGLLIALLLGGLLWTRWSPPPAGPAGGGSGSPFTEPINRARDTVDRLEEAERQRQEELRQLP
jgi:hypothetical protein